MNEDHNELIPPEDDPRVAQAVIELAEETIIYRKDKGLFDNWVQNYALGKAEHVKKEKKDLDYAFINMLHKNRQEAVNMLTDNNPTFNLYLAGGGSDFKEQLDILKLTQEQWWRETEQQDILADDVHNGETYGNAIDYLYFDKDLDGGEVCTEPYDPFYYSPYPPQERKAQKAHAHFIFEPMSVREMKRLHPKAVGIVADETYKDDVGDTRDDTGPSSGSGNILTKWSTSVLSLFRAKGGKDSKTEDMTMRITVWVKDYTLARDEDGQELVNGLEEPIYKYKGNIRCIRVCTGGNVLLDDRDNPCINPDLPEEAAKQTYVWDKFPFATCQSLRDTTQFFAQSDFDQLKQLNRKANQSLTQFDMIVSKLARMNPINPKTSGIPDEHFNKYMHVLSPINSKEAAGLGWMQPPPMSPMVVDAVQMWVKLFIQMSGMNDIDQAGANGQGVIAYKAIAALLENMHRRLKDKDRSYNKLIRERGRIAVGLMQNWYKEKWIMNDSDPESEPRQINGEELIIPFKMSVVSGSTMPVSKVQRREEAMELNKTGNLPTKYLLEALEYDNADEIVEYLERGPIGKILERLMELLPKETVQQIGQIATMDDKKFEAGVKNGEIQPIQLPREGVDAEAEEDRRLDREGKGAETKKAATEANLKAAETQLKDIEADLVRARIETEREKAKSERKKQEQVDAGIAIDREVLKIKKAELVGNIKKKVSGGAGPGGGGPYNERGMTSNNKAE